MELKTTRRSLADEKPYGVYVWRCKDGEYLGDEEDRLLSINSMRGDREKIAALRKVAEHYGFGDGEAVFWSGKRQVTDEEYEEQEERGRSGLVPDPWDLDAMHDQIQASRND